LEKQKYAEIVIKEIHSGTTHGALPWRKNKILRSISAQPTPAIQVSIRYLDDGPDAAIWEEVAITHPVGNGITLIGNPSSSGLAETKCWPTVRCWIN